MKLSVHPASELEGSELLVVPAFQGEAPLLPSGISLPAASLRGFKGEFRETRVSDAAKGGIERVLVIGLGKKADLSTERLRRAAAIGVQRADALACASASLWAPSALESVAGGAHALGLALAEGALMGSYRFQEFKSKPKPVKLHSVALLGGGRELRAGAARGRVLAEANCFVRDLQNMPANRMRPRDLAKHAHALAKASPRISCKVLDEKAMRALGMGALLAVAQGSVEPPQLIHLVYTPKKKSKGKLAFVGKGLTFDSGGISIKPAAKMWEMKYDMSGGAAVLGVFHALVKLDAHFEVHGLVPSSENLPDARAVKPGDLVTAMNGTTIEVLNTDAEGRLILADAISYAQKKIKPDTLVTLATLTGAVVVALGHEHAGLFASTEKLRDHLRAAGDDVGEKLWPLPLMDFHKEQLRGEVADLKNINSPDQGGGSIAGAAFLSYFAGDLEWAHLDIAGSAWGGMQRDWVGGSQGSGVGTRLLLRYLELR